VVVLLLLSITDCISGPVKLALLAITTVSVVGEVMYTGGGITGGAAKKANGKSDSKSNGKSNGKSEDASASKPARASKPRSAKAGKKPTEDESTYKKINLDKFEDGKVIALDGADEDIATIRDWFPDYIKDKSKLQISKESIFSLSRKDASEKLSQSIKIILPDEDVSKLTITDATANVGGNTLNFATHFKDVNAVEIEPVAYSALENNVKVAGLKNVKTVNDDYLKVMNDLSQDVIFFDPPWGGPDYWKEKALTLKLGDKPLYEVINELKSEPKLVVVKAPKNFAFAEFKQHVNSDHVWSRRYYNHQMVFVKFGSGPRPVKPAEQVSSEDAPAESASTE